MAENGDETVTGAASEAFARCLYRMPRRTLIFGGGISFRWAIPCYCCVAAMRAVASTTSTTCYWCVAVLLVELGVACGRYAACDDVNAVCVNGVCQCAAGFAPSATDNTCRTYLSRQRSVSRHFSTESLTVQVKPAFHDADTDSDSPDTPTSLRPTRAIS